MHEISMKLVTWQLSENGTGINGNISNNSRTNRQKRDLYGVWMKKRGAH